MGDLMNIGFYGYDTITPIFLTALIAVFLFTGKWKRDILLMISLIMSSFCWVLIVNWNEQAGGIATMVTYLVLITVSSFKDEIMLKLKNIRKNYEK